MNRRSPGLSISKAIVGFIQYKAAEGLSPTTLRSYEHDLKLWLEFMTEMPVNWIKAPKVRDYFPVVRSRSRQRPIELACPSMCRTPVQASPRSIKPVSSSPSSEVKPCAAFHRAWVWV